MRLSKYTEATEADTHRIVIPAKHIARSKLKRKGQYVVIKRKKPKVERVKAPRKKYKAKPRTKEQMLRYNRNYRAKHKEQALAYNRMLYNTNTEYRERKLAKQRETYQKNREVVRKRQKAHYEANKQAYANKVCCVDCGLEMCKGSIKRHVKNKHAVRDTQATITEQIQSV